jgi:hypothetical protein
MSLINIFQLAALYHQSKSRCCSMAVADWLRLTRAEIE